MRQVATVIAGCALAAAVACGGDNNSTAMGTNEQPNDSAAEARDTAETQTSDQPVTLTGCLQKRGGGISNEYLLTMINEPAGVGTSGSVTSTGSSVEREQMRIAARTFRLDPQDGVEQLEGTGVASRCRGALQLVAPRDRVPQRRGEDDADGAVLEELDGIQPSDHVHGILHDGHRVGVRQQDVRTERVEER